MIRGKLVKNNIVQPNSRELDLLKDDFPQYFDHEGNFMIDRLQETLKENEIDITKEGYELKFLGKSYAKLLTSTETKTVITPDNAHNSKNDNKNSENLYIVGDNIDVIKHLLNSYSGEISCIYIDPPYNIGKEDFIYPDNFEYTKESLAKAVGIEEDEAERILNIAGTSTHSAWLTFMYPRLLLARELLSDEGAIFISIDNNEQANLKLLCDEVYGEENFVECIIWNKRIPKNDEGIGSIHESILIYAKSKSKDSKFIMPKEGITEIWSLLKKAKSQDMDIQKAEELLKKLYKDNSYSRGITLYNSLDKNYEPWGKINMCWPNGNTEGDKYEILHPITKKPVKIPDRGWRWIKETFYKEANMDKEGNYRNVEKLRDGSYRCGNMWFASNENTQPSSIKYLKEVQNMLLRSIISLKSDGGIELKNLFAEKNYFSYPKPTSLIKRLIYSMQLKSGDIVMDFFSGSATTADAVMQLNADDGENRRYIMVQLPEKIKGDKYKAAYKAGYQTIDEIGRARIEKAARKIKVETINDIDYGYKLYRLNKPKQNTLDKIVDFDPTEQIISENMIEEFCFENVSGKETILSTWLNEDGYGLGIESNKIILDNYEADVFKNSIYIIEEGLTSKDVMELIRKIENNELNITRIVIYSYSINFNQVHELKNNVKNLRNNKNVSVIERY